MNIIIAPDSYKECLTSIEVADLLEQGFQKVFPDAFYWKFPLSDGGEGFADILVRSTGGSFIDCSVHDPLMKKIKIRVGVSGKDNTAIIEMASASGLHLVPKSQRNPMFTTTFGTGELIKTALDKGFRKFVIGIGGSATTDGGIGAMQALGGKFLDKNGDDIPLGGIGLKSLTKFDLSNLDKRISECSFIIAYDVNNPLTGEHGAAGTFSRQKGADNEEIEFLEKYLINYANMLEEFVDTDMNTISGSGAAGGLGAAFYAFLKAELRPGIELVLEATDLKSYLQKADIVITGEGEMDSQTVFGKVPYGVLKFAEHFEIPVISICGNIKGDKQDFIDLGFSDVIGIVSDSISKQKAIKEVHKLLPETAKNIALKMREKKRVQ